MSHDPVDVLIVGAGASGAALAWSLLGSRMRILCLEQGPMMSDADYPSRNPDYELSRYAAFSIDPNVRRLPQDYPINSDASPIAPVNFNAVGGSTINFSAHWPRMHPSDFRTRSLDGVADDWPVDYDTLEPYYATNDRITGASGLAGNPAYPPYEPPLPPLPLGKLGRTLAEGFNRQGLALVAIGCGDPQPRLRRSRQVRQRRHLRSGLRHRRQVQRGLDVLAGSAAGGRGAAHRLPGAGDHVGRARHGERGALSRHRRVACSDSGRSSSSSPATASARPG